MQIPQAVTDEIQGAGIKTAWPAAIAALSLSSWGPQEWFYVFSGFFVILQSAYVAWKWWRELKKPDDTDRAGA